MSLATLFFMDRGRTDLGVFATVLWEFILIFFSGGRLSASRFVSRFSILCISCVFMFRFLHGLIAGLWVLLSILFPLVLLVFSTRRHGKGIFMGSC